MGKIRLVVKTSYGEISLEGDSLSDFRNTLLEIGLSLESINGILEDVLHATRQKLQEPAKGIPVAVAPSKPEIVGLVEYTSDGNPHITVAPDRLTAKMVIGLLLYSKDPNPISLNELTELVNTNWKSVDTSYVSANLVYMRPLVMKLGAKGSYSYSLSGFGKNWVETELMPKLKGQSSAT